MFLIDFLKIGKDIGRKEGENHQNHPTKTSTEKAWRAQKTCKEVKLLKREWKKIHEESRGAEREKAGGEGGKKVRQHLTGFSCFHCELPDDDFPDVRGRGRKGRGCGAKEKLKS